MPRLGGVHQPAAKDLPWHVFRLRLGPAQAQCFANEEMSRLHQLVNDLSDGEQIRRRRLAGRLGHESWAEAKHGCGEIGQSPWGGVPN